MRSENPIPTSPRPVALTRFAGRAGDHNDRAMVASGHLAEILAASLGEAVASIGEPVPVLSTTWEIELAAAMPDLQAMARRYQEILSSGRVPVTALSRCAVALATLPVVATYRPDAVVVWFDAHADLNTPAESTTGYLGGLALSGPLGRWDSGLGRGLDSANVILVGARDIDPPELALIDHGTIALVRVGPSMAAELAAAVDGRPVYVHIDCDVLEAGTVPTDYLVPGGMSLEQLRACAEVLARSEVVGLEIGELETGDPSAAATTAAHEPAERIRAALEPILDRWRP